MLADEIPKVSVIIPHYNMHSFLPQAVESVANQEYDNIELIIVDDGSDEMLHRELLSADNLPTKLLEIEHIGKPTAVNQGFEKSSGDYLTILDADDLLPKRSLLQRVRALEKNKADLCIGSFEVSYNGEKQAVRSIDVFLNESNDEIIDAFLTWIVAPLHQNAMLFSRKLLERVGQMDPQMLRGQDKDFGIRLLRKSKKTILIKEPVYVYNRYDRPIERRLYNRYMGLKYKLIVLRRYFSGLRGTVYLGWVFCLGLAKFVYNLFGVYKK